MIKIGDLCPVFFDVIKYEYANENTYRQCFDTSDGILIQIFCDEGEIPNAILKDKINKIDRTIGLKTYKVNDRVDMYYTYLYPGEGVFSIVIEDNESEMFEVCEGSNGLLMEYSHKDNNSAFDNIFWDEETKFTFKMRLVGGFKPSGISFEVDNEQFVNQKQEIVELYSIPYITKTLIIGDVNGVPYYIAEHINKVLCLSDVKFSGANYVREGNSRLEKAETIGKKEMFIWNINLRPLKNPISGMGGLPEEATTASAVGFAINNAKDGEVLVYDSKESAFVNTNQLSSI